MFEPFDHKKFWILITGVAEKAKTVWEIYVV